MFTNYKIADRSYVSYVKREIHNLVVASEFSSQKIGEVDIIVAELTSNLIKFAQTGELLYRVSADEYGIFFEVHCIDNGKGIQNLSRMMQDGISSANTLGQGLGAIGRLSNTSSIYTLSDWGTVVNSKVYKNEVTHFDKKKTIDFGAVQVCYPGEKVCGDGYAVKEVNGGTQFFMGDGLGHGINAHDAVQEAIKAFKECGEISPTEILRHIHQSVKKTRGLVAAVAHLDMASQKWALCGIGNISVCIYTGLTPKNYTSYNGTVGHNIPRTFTDSVQELEKYQTLIMHSDGIDTKWNLNGLPGIIKHDPNLVAAVLYKDNARHNDDMTVIAAKINL